MAVIFKSVSGAMGGLTFSYSGCQPWHSSGGYNMLVPIVHSDVLKAWPRSYTTVKWKARFLQVGASAVVPGHRGVSERGEASRGGQPRQLPRPRLPRPQRLQAVPAGRPGLPPAAAPPQGVSGWSHLHLRRPPVLSAATRLVTLVIEPPC